MYELFAVLNIIALHKSKTCLWIMGVSAPKSYAGKVLLAQLGSDLISVKLGPVDIGRCFPIRAFESFHNLGKFMIMIKSIFVILLI